MAACSKGVLIPVETHEHHRIKLILSIRSHHEFSWRYRGPATIEKPYINSGFHMRKKETMMATTTKLIIETPATKTQMAVGHYLQSNYRMPFDQQVQSDS